VITDIDLRFERSTGRLTSKTARNVVVTRDVEKNPAATALITHYRPVAERIGSRVVGTLASGLSRDENEHGESSLGDVIADAFLTMSRNVVGGAGDVAFIQPGGIRADLPAAESSSVTFAQLFDVLPFGNVVSVKTVTGDAILQALEQQFSVDYHDRVLQVSAGFAYAYDRTRPEGQRIDRESVRINGQPLEPFRRYRVAATEFLWSGGDGFSALKAGTEPTTIGADVDVLAAYVVSRSPVPPGPQDRIRRIR
jgi:5'-nucleotidase